MAVEETYFDEDTLIKVKAALHEAGVQAELLDDCVIEMQQAGILFRERK